MALLPSYTLPLSTVNTSVLPWQAKASHVYGAMDELLSGRISSGAEEGKAIHTEGQMCHSLLQILIGKEKA